MVTFISHNPAETEALGAAWARGAADGWLLGLSGELGAGKTQLVRGLARGLGFGGRVQSPTFALFNQYEGGRLPLFHLDLYRLNSRDDIFHAGLGEYLERPAGIVAVEWIEKWLPAELKGWRTSNIEHRTSNIELPTLNFQPSIKLRLVWINTLSETERQIVYEDFGA